MAFKDVKPEELALNPFQAVGRDWLLVGAGDEALNNAMTASWGGMGVLWGKPAVTVYLRPQRYTRKLLEANDLFTVSILPEAYRAQLMYCGRVTGYDVPNKIVEAGLTPLFVDGTTAIEEAHTVLVCRKMYADDMPPENFIDGSADARWYPDHDYHRMYIGEVLRALVKE